MTRKEWWKSGRKEVVRMLAETLTAADSCRKDAVRLRGIPEGTLFMEMLAATKDQEAQWFSLKAESLKRALERGDELAENKEE